jgi:hypothetical protein
VPYPCVLCKGGSSMPLIAWLRDMWNSVLGRCTFPTCPRWIMEPMARSVCPPTLRKLREGWGTPFVTLPSKLGNLTHPPFAFSQAML